MKPSTEKLHKSALLAVACKTILLGVCDDLKETTLYKHATKQKVNSLTDELEKFVSQMYKGISEEEELQFNALVRTVENAAYLMASMSPSEIDRLNALLLAYKNGEVYEASSDKAMSGMINQKRVRKVEPELIN
ncbi:hypothetical protein [Spirosoma sp. KUDC1026]|uniref:hypothetical protein n=1 Tax=Spirosoma sp. KUDC1026 TaxID=2745947 RepID=UPI00159B8C9E|nr:hypothetical protein [Spirosoma sp. KUDC1026]QKZ15167.1 hypothetical protein HU175_22100 [Spirosoma sp. KUDC1026]